MENIIPGYYVTKPVVTQEECDTYAAMASALNAHNAACKVGDTLWGIEEKVDCYMRSSKAVHCRSLLLHSLHWRNRSPRSKLKMQP